MASNIDPTKPSGTQAFGANLRANLAAAKDEIEALQTAASGNMAGFEASDTFRVDDENVTYSQSVHGDFVAFLFQGLQADRTLTLPAEEGRGGAMIFVRVRVSSDFQVTVRIEDPNNLGTYFEQPVANDFVRVLRKAADSGPGNPQFWDHFALHQSGAREPVSWLDQRPNLTVPEGTDKLLIRDASDDEAPKLITLDNLGFSGGGGGQSWTNGGAFDPTDVDLTSLTIFNPYSQDGTINWALAASPVTGGTAIVRFTSNGGTLNWGSTFVAANPQVTLSDIDTLPTGEYLFFLKYMPDWGGIGTNRVIVSISPGGDGNGGGGGNGGGDNATFPDDATDYSATPFAIATGGAAKNETRRFTGNFANKINFPAGIAAASYGTLVNGSGADMRLQSPAGVTINGVDNADIGLRGTVSWWRQAANEIIVEGETDEALELGGATVSGNLVKVVSASGTLNVAEHSGAEVITTGNVTIPTEQGFNCTLRAGGAHTVSFNGTTSPAMATGDLMSIIVESSTVIQAVPTAAADKVAFN